MKMQASSDFYRDASRKRLRRDTRSCFQCRRRKVKCQLTTEDVAACAACIRAGNSCTLEQPSTEATDSNLPAQGMHREQEDRLERIENMLTRLVQAQASQVPAEFDNLARPLFGGDLGANSSHDSLFWEEMDVHLMNPPGLLPLENYSQCFPDKHEADVKQSLVSLLPSDEDIINIVSNTTAWLWGLRCPPGSILRPNEPITDLGIAAISNGSTVVLAKSLLYLAIYMQQLPPGFDTRCLRVPGVEATIECYVSTVNSLVLSKEEMVCSADGLECLHLLGMIYINEGAPRKAWLSFRRALDVAKLRGFRDSFACSAPEAQSDELAARRRIWLDAIAGDCFSSLLLGLEPVLGSEPFGPENNLWDDPLTDADANFERKFYPIVARLAQKNFLGLQHDYGSTQEIDQDLDKLWASMPSDWQRTPTLRSGRSLESAKDYSRLICHLWFFQIRIFVHLPFAFSNPENGNLESSRVRCLEASRIILHSYLGLQQEGRDHPRCKVVDVAAFLAAVTILLVDLDHHPRGAAASSRRRAYSSDTALLEQFMHSMEVLGMSCGREHIAKQGARVLSAMLTTSKELEGMVFSDPDPSEHAFNTTAALAWDDLKTATALKDAKSVPPSPVAHGSSIRQGLLGLEDILASSFRKALGARSAAARVIDLMFSVER